MRRLKRSSFLFCLVIGLVVTAPLLPLPGVAQSVVQNQTSEIDQVGAEGIKLFEQGSAESLKQAIPLFERAFELSKTAQATDKQALSLLLLGRVYNALGKNQEALEYYTQALPLFRALRDKAGEAATTNSIGIAYDESGEKRKAIEYYSQALSLFRATEDPRGEATTLNNIGLLRSDLGEKRKALEYCNQALLLFRTIEDRSGEANALNSIGLIYSDLGEKRKALEYYSNALSLLHDTKDRRAIAVTLSNAGRAYSDLGENQEALEYYNHALSLFRASEYRSGEATALSGIAGVYSNLGEKQKALDYYNQALNLERSVKDPNGEASALNNIGLIYSNLGEMPKALDYYNQALLIFRAIENRHQEAITLNNIGKVYSDLDEKRKALEYYDQALQIKRAVEDRDGEATTLNNIGSVYTDLSENQKALEYYNQALSIFRTVENRQGEAATFNGIARIYLSLGEVQKALEYRNQALSLWRAIGDRDGEAGTLNGIGEIHFTIGETQKALEYHNQALPLFRAVGNRSEEGTTLNNIGLFYSNLGKRREALEYYKQSLSLSRVVGSRSGEAATLNNVGQVYDDLGEKQKALEYYNQALPLSRMIGDLSGEARILSNIGLVLADERQLELSIAIFKQSVNVFESIRQNNRKLPKELQESYAKSISPTYQELANLLIKQNRLPEAQAVLELLRIKELNTYTRDSKSPSNGISFTPAEQKAIDEVFNRYGTAAELARQLSDCDEKKCSNLKTLQQARDLVNDEIRKMLDRLRITLKDQVIDISKLNTQEYTEAADKVVNAQPGTVLIYPVITETKTQFLLAFKAGAGDQAPVTFRAIDGANIGSDILFQTANALRNALADPTSDLKTLQDTSQKLYTWLIKPLEPEISNPSIKHLVFVGDRATRHIPFAALYDGKEYLINKRYTLTTVLAASTTRDPSEPQPKAPNVLAVGATEFKGASPLPYVKPEILSIVQTPENKQGIFPGLSYLNDQFSFERLRDSLKGHNILHIATHGNLDPVNIDKSYLLTSSGAQITKSEIQRLRDYGLKGVHMVILSACDTGTGGKNSDNLEIAGISHYFMEGGAKSVIASLWKVNDPATALFMQEFYKHLKAGMTKAQAIRQVQQDFINGKLTAQDAPTRSIAVVAEKISDRPTSINFAHPYYWSPFILIGNNL